MIDGEGGVAGARLQSILYVSGCKDSLSELEVLGGHMHTYPMLVEYDGYLSFVNSNGMMTCGISKELEPS